MQISWEKIKFKAETDYENMSEKEKAVADWVSCLLSDSFDLDLRLEDHEAFSDDERQSVLIWRLKFERNHIEEQRRMWYGRYHNLKRKLDNFVEVSRMIMGKADID